MQISSELAQLQARLRQEIEAHQQTQAKLKKTSEQLVKLKKHFDWLRKKNTQLEAVFRANPDAISFADAEGRLKMFNPALTKLFEYQPEDIIGQPIQILSAHPEEQTHHNYFNDEVDRVEPESYEAAYRCRQGRIFVGETVSKPVRNKQNHLVGVVNIVRDVSKRKHVEKALRSLSKQLLRKNDTLASFSEALKQLHRISTTNYRNFTALFDDYLKTGCEILELPIGMISQVQEQTYTIKAVQSELDFLIPGLELELKDTYCASVVNRGKTITYRSQQEIIGHPAYQKLKLACYIGTPIFVNDEIYGTLNFSATKPRRKDFAEEQLEIIELMAQGISKYIEVYQGELERKKVEVALQESEERFQKIADTAPIMIWISGTDKLCTYFNRAWLEFTGRTLEEEKGNGWTKGVYADDLQNCLDNYNAAFEARQSVQMEYRLRRFDGDYNWILAIGRPLYRPDSSFAGYIGSCVDIHERKKAEKILEQTNAELEERVEDRTIELLRSNQELEHFAYIASHDLREPLRKIKSFTDLLREDYYEQIDEQADRYLDYISDGAVRMQNLISDLLAYSRIGKGEPTLIPTDLNLVLKQILNDLSILIAEHQAVITSNSLPIIQANPLEMGQVFQNLITNGIKFRSDRPPCIHINATQEEEFWLISVRDNGIGINPKFAERIFGIFQRLHSRAKYPGTGIGLAICRKIVERYGGGIWVESTPDRGSTFFFTMPVNQEPKFIHLK